MIRWSLPFILVLHSALLAAQQADSTLVNMASEQLKNKQCKEVVRTLAPMLDRSPAPAEALLLRAKCRIWFTKELEAGMRDLQDALVQEPDHVAIRAFRVTCTTTYACSTGRVRTWTLHWPMPAIQRTCCML